MIDSNDSPLDAKVTRYDIARLRHGMLLLPIAIFATVAARRFPNVLTGIVVFGAQGVALALLFTAAKRFGWQPLRVERGGVSVGATGVRIEKHKVHRWTLVGGLARLYGLEQSFKVRARDGREEELSASLSRLFGPPLKLKRRGSFRARMIALAVAACGLIVCVLGAINNTPWLMGIGVPAFGIGTATFGALSQRTT